jgi:flavodoxin
MKALVVYDSKYGNTEMIARTIGEEVGGRLLLVSEAKPAELMELDLLIIGSPTHGGWYTEGIKEMLDTLPVLEGVNLAVFDTRTKRSLFGFAAPRMARDLEKTGWELLAPPEGFVVLGIKGPLKEGELERAASWAKSITQ